MSLKPVAPVQIQQRYDGLPDLNEIVRGQQIRQDHIAVAPQHGQVRIRDGRIDAVAAARCPSISSRQIAREVHQ